MTNIGLEHMDRCMMSIRSVLLISTILLSFDGISAEKLTVYRWVDENNVVHFSQQQPAHDNYTEISMVNNKNTSALPDSRVTTEAKAPSIPETTASSDASNEKCISAKQNLTTLKDFDKIQYKDENGNIKVLSELEKQQQLEMNTKQVEVYCEDN